MQTDCFFCHLRTLEKQIKKFAPPEDVRKQLVGEFIDKYTGLQKQYNPYAAAAIHAMIRKYLKVEDPYESEKAESNRKALEIVKEWRKNLDQTSYKAYQAIKLALAANIIDFGPGHKFDIAIDIGKLQKQELAIDDSSSLFNSIKNNTKVLYLADNAGEIVFDKLFLEQIAYADITVAVRGFPVINDATMKDASIAGLQELAKVIHNGNDAPSTLLDRCSAEFMNAYREADVIIAKGQGNFEGLMFEKDPRIYFALVTKCEVIANFIGIEKNKTALLNSRRIDKTKK